MRRPTRSRRRRSAICRRPPCSGSGDHHGVESTSTRDARPAARTRRNRFGVDRERRRAERPPGSRRERCPLCRPRPSRARRRRPAGRRPSPSTTSPGRIGPSPNAWSVDEPVPEARPRRSRRADDVRRRAVSRRRLAAASRAAPRVERPRRRQRLGSAPSRLAIAPRRRTAGGSRSVGRDPVSRFAQAATDAGSQLGRAGDVGAVVRRMRPGRQQVVGACSVAAPGRSAAASCRAHRRRRSRHRGVPRPSTSSRLQPRLDRVPGAAASGSRTGRSSPLARSGRTCGRGSGRRRPSGRGTSWPNTSIWLSTRSACVLADVDRRVDLPRRGTRSRCRGPTR